MDPGRQNVEDDSLQECERRFREVCMQLINKNHARSPRKKLLGNARPVQKIALRPSMIDRACLTKAVVSSTPMPYNKQQPFTPDSSGSVSPINDSTKTPKKVQPLVHLNRLNQSGTQNGTVISLSSTNISAKKKQSPITPAKNNTNANESIANKLPTNAATDENKSHNLNNIISKLVLNTSVLSEVSGNMCNTTNKNIQTSKNNSAREERTSPTESGKKLSRTLFGKTSSTQGRQTQTQVRQTQTGLSLNGHVFSRRSSVSDTSVKSDSSDTIRSWEVTGLLAPNLIGNKDDESSSDEDDNIAMDVGAPWRAPSGLQDAILPAANSVIPNGDSLEITLDDTFLPKPPKKRKVFANKKKNVANNVKRKEELNNSIRGKKTGKPELDEKGEMVEKKLTKENVKHVASSESSPSPTKKKRPDKVQTSKCSLQNVSFTDNIDELSSADSSIFLPIENNLQKTVENSNSKRREKTFIGKAKNNITLNSLRIQDNSFKKPRSVNKKHNALDPAHIIDNDKDDVNHTMTRSASKMKEQSKRTKQDEVSKNSISNKSIGKVARNKRGKHQNCYEETNFQDQHLNETHSEKHRGKTKEIDVTSKRKLERTKEKVPIDDLLGDAHPSISNSEVTETKRIPTPEKQRRNYRENAKTQTDVPEASQDVLSERVNTSLREFQSNSTERRSPRKQIKKNEESNLSITKNYQYTDVVDRGGKQNKFKKNLKRSNGIVQDLQAAFQSVESNAVEEILPQEDSYPRIDVQNPLNSSSVPKSLKKKNEQLNTGSIRKNESTVQSYMESKKNNTKKNKKGSSEMKENSELSYLDSGFGASSQQLETFKKPTAIKRVKKVPKEVEPTEQSLSPRRSTRERRPTLLKNAGFIVCRNRQEYEQANKSLCGTRNSKSNPVTVRKSASSRISKSNSSNKRKNTKGASSVRSTASTFSPIAEINSEANLDVVDDLQPISGSSSSKGGASPARYTAGTFSPISEINSEANLDLVDDLPATSGLGISTKENGENKNYVLTGRTQKRRKNTKNSKKLLESLNRTFDNAPHELNSILNVCDGDKIRAIRWKLKDPKYTQLKGMPGVSVCVTDNYSNGLLKIEGGKYKPRQVASHHQLSFCVLEGRGEIGVQDKCEMFTVQESFIVPPGCEYFIKNINKKKPLSLFFTKVPKSC